MKRITLFLFFLIFSTYLRAFSNEDFKGSYAFRLVGNAGIVLATQPRTVATGVLFTDGKGNLFGRGTFRSAGISCVGNIKGSYHVDPDGRGRMTSVFQTSTPGCITSVLNLGLVVFENGKSFEVANTDNDHMAGRLTRQDKSFFRGNDLKGNYAFRLEGPSSVVSVSLPHTVGVGIFTADGFGNLTGSGNLRSKGVTCYGNFKGVYIVNSDGSGHLATVFNPVTPSCGTSSVILKMALYNQGKGGEIASLENDYMEGSIHLQAS